MTLTAEEIEAQKKAAEDQTPQEKVVQDKLDKLSSDIKTSRGENEAVQQLAKLAANPLIRQILKAEEDGKTLKLVDAAESQSLLPKEDGDDTPVDLEELTRAELVKFTAKQTVKIIAPLFEKKISELSDSITPLRDSIMASASDKMADSIAEVKKRYPDFEDHRKAMSQIHSETRGGLSVEELYLISRKRKGGKGVLEVSSEKPTSTSAKVKAEKIRDAPLPRGRAGFDQLLQEALDNLEISET
ncbi:hypothetical protein LCGC14_2544430 [marine sediment metagenome]|uniref:Uncharacterized protein n=1 Tax=marine sediment metagenome TaxID=412755 RepID=A0A0F9DHU3_9ZZZZ